MKRKRKIYNECDFLKIKFECPVCKSPAIPVNGACYWCQKCGWRYYTNGNGRADLL